MDLEELRTVQTRERATDGLQELRESFYEDVAEYIESLREKRRRAAEAADDPFRSPEVNDLTDEIETAEQVVEAIYERRIGKLVKQASLAAAGMPDDQDGLTAEEAALYEGLVELIEANKREVLDIVTGKRKPGAGGSEPAAIDGDDDSPADDVREPEPPAPPEAGPDSDGATNGVEVRERAGEPADGDAETDTEDQEDGGETEASEIERTKVRVTEDVGEIFGVDERAYDLQTDDVVHLPRENATPLLDRDAAERME